MQTGAHAVGWGLQRAVIAVALLAVGALLAYAALVFVIIVIQAMSAFGS